MMMIHYSITITCIRREREKREHVPQAIEQALRPAVNLPINGMFPSRQGRTRGLTDGVIRDEHSGMAEDENCRQLGSQGYIW